MPTIQIRQNQQGGGAGNGGGNTAGGAQQAGTVSSATARTSSTSTPSNTSSSLPTKYIAAIAVVAVLVLLVALLALRCWCQRHKRERGEPFPPRSDEEGSDLMGTVEWQRRMQHIGLGEVGSWRAETRRPGAQRGTESDLSPLPLGPSGSSSSRSGLVERTSTQGPGEDTTPSAESPAGPPYQSEAPDERLPSYGEHYCISASSTAADTPYLPIFQSRQSSVELPRQREECGHASCEGRSRSCEMVSFTSPSLLPAS